MTHVARIEEPGTILLYDGQLARVVGITDGRTLTLDLIEADACPTCGQGTRLHLVESLPPFQDHVQPVVTISIR